MKTHVMSRLARAAAGAIGVALVAALAFSGAASAAADTEERALAVTREDGSPIGTLFSDWTMVPGDIVTTRVVAHRTGGGVSSLLITLGDDSTDQRATPTPVQKDVVITVAGNGTTFRSTAAELLRGDVIFDLGRSSIASVPIDVTFELPFSSGNATQLQSLDLSLVVVAADTEVDPGDTGGGSTTPPSNAGSLPNLPSTGASVRDALIAAAVATCLGLLLIGGRRRRDEAVDPD